jgi:hypothetical protein
MVLSHRCCSAWPPPRLPARRLPHFGHNPSSHAPVEDSGLAERFGHPDGRLAGTKLGLLKRRRVKTEFASFFPLSPMWATKKKPSLRETKSSILDENTRRSLRPQPSARILVEFINIQDGARGPNTGPWSPTSHASPPKVTKNQLFCEVRVGTCQVRHSNVHPTRPPPIEPVGPPPTTPSPSVGC